MPKKMRWQLAEYLGIIGTSATTYYLLGTGVTKLSDNPSPKVDKKAYINDVNASAEITGYENSFAVAFDKIISNTALNALEAVGDNQLTGDDAKFELVRADLNAPQLQVMTKVVTAAPDADGTITLTITAAGMDNSPLDVEVELVALTHTSQSLVAAAIRTALAADEDIAAFFTVGGTGASVVLTAKAAAADDATMAMEFADTDSTSATMGATEDTTPGALSTYVARQYQVAYEAGESGGDATEVMTGGGTFHQLGDLVLGKFNTGTKTFTADS